MSQDVFQMKMDLIMEKCPGVISIHDDIVIYGTKMIPPIDKQQLASFIGMVTYMGNFVPHLSHHTEPHRAMLEQDVIFYWDQMANSSFQKIKDLIAKTAAQPLRYYYRTKPVVVQADARARASQTLRPGTQTSKGNFWPLYSLVSSSTRTSWEGHLQWSLIISHWK